MKINTNDTEKLSAAIANAEAPYSGRTISAEDIQNKVASIERKLSSIMAKKDWTGLEFYIDLHAHAFPGVQESTKFTLKRFSNGWFVTALYRGRTSQRRIDQAPLTESQKIAMVDYIQTNYL